MTEQCADPHDTDDPETVECDRELDHPGRHAFRGEWAIISWSDR